MSIVEFENFGLLTNDASETGESTKMPVGKGGGGHAINPTISTLEGVQNGCG